MAEVWKDKRDVCLLTNIHDPPREGNCHDEHGNAIKPAIVADYNPHMGHVDNSDRLTSSYTASRRTWKWTKKLFFHLLDLAIVYSYILLFSCGGKKISHRDFHLTFMREMLARTGHDHPCLWEDQPQLLITSEDWTHVTISTGLAAILNSGVVCSARGVKRTVLFKCVKCDLALCVDRICFEDYH